MTLVDGVANVSYGATGANTTVSSLSPGCRFYVNKMVTDSSDVISAFTLRVLEMVIYCGVMPVLMLVGIVTNSLSCIVFYRLGNLAHLLFDM